MKKLLIASLLFASVTAFADFKKEMTPAQVKAEVTAQLADKVPPVVILRQARVQGYDVTKVLIAAGVDPSDIVESTRSGLDNAEIPFSQSRAAPGSSVGRSFSVSPS
jgi:hypothetical protein